MVTKMSKEYMAEWRVNNPKKVSAYRRKFMERNQLLIEWYKQEHPCVDCREPDTIVLEFDHLPQFEKLAGVATLTTASVQRLWIEIQKCEVVCANCHTRRTKGRGSGKGGYRPRGN